MVIYTIKDLEKLSGVKAHTLRIWEKRYNILQPKRTASNVRYYQDEDLKHILNIALLNRHGIKISKIAEMNPSAISKKVAELTDIDESFEGQLDGLTISLIELDEERFVKILNKNIEQRGFANTILEVVYPLLDKLAVMWLSGSIKSIHERFVSHIIKRKCLAEIDKLPITKNEAFLIFLPEGDTNELSLLFLHFLIRENGFRVVNAGIDANLHDLKEAAVIRFPKYIYTIINDNMESVKLQGYLKMLCDTFPDSQVILSGIQIRSFQITPEISEAVTILGSSTETINFLKNI